MPTPKRSETVAPAHQQQTESLAEIPTTLAPPPLGSMGTTTQAVVLPIEGFHDAVGARARQVDEQPRAAHPPGSHSGEGARGRAFDVAVDVRTVPPHGTFSLRGSTAVLRCAPARRRPGPEVEPAGRGEAARYPYDCEVNDKPIHVVPRVSASGAGGAAHAARDDTKTVARRPRTTGAEERQVGMGASALSTGPQPSVRSLSISSDTGTDRPANAQPADGLAPLEEADSPTSSEDTGKDTEDEDEILVYSAVETEMAARPACGSSSTAATVHDVRELQQSSPDAVRRPRTPAATASAPTSSSSSSAASASPPPSGDDCAGNCERQRLAVDPVQVRAALSTQASPHGSRQRRDPSAEAAAGASVECRVADPNLSSGAEATVERVERRRGSYADPTASWARRHTQRPLNTNPSASGEVPAEPPLSEKSTGGASLSPARRATSPRVFRLATAALGQSSAARRQQRAEAERKEKEAAEARQLEKARRVLARVRETGQAEEPRGYSAIAEEGRRKRKALEEAERQRRLWEEQQLTFTPNISRTTARPRKECPTQIGAGTDGPTTATTATATAITTTTTTTADDTIAEVPKRTSVIHVGSFLAASKEWEARRERKIEAAKRGLLAKEEAARRDRFVNPETNRIMQRRLTEQGTGTDGVTVFDRLAMEAAARETARRTLMERYTPSFRPETRTTRSGSRTATVGEPCTTSTETAEGEPRTENAAGSSPSGPNVFESLYQRSREHRERTEHESARRRESEVVQRRSSSSVKRTKEEIDAYVALMAAREAERRAKFEQRAELERERDAKAAAEAVATAATRDPRKTQLVQRGRQRMELREEQKRRAAEEARRRKAQEEAAAVEGSAMRRRSSAKSGVGGSSVERMTPARLPPTLEAHEQRMAERRARELEKLRQQLLEKEMAECTFKPVVCPASEEMAGRVRFTLTEEGLSLSPYSRDGGGARRVSSAEMSRAALRWQSFYSEATPFPGEEFSGRPEDVGPVRSTSARAAAGLRPVVTESFSIAGRSPQPRQPGGRSNGSSALFDTGSSEESPPAPRDTDSLAKEVESLERVLNEWKQLEEEVSV